MLNKTRHIIQTIYRSLHWRTRRALCVLTTLLLLMAGAILPSCEREPLLHLHYDDNVTLQLPTVELELKVFWDYFTNQGIPYDWQAEWFYGWDDTDREIFGELGYEEPKVFHLRRYHTGNVPFAPHTSVNADLVYGNLYSGQFDWGYWDLLAWNDIQTIDGIQSLLIYERPQLDYVTASTNQTMHHSRYQAPRYTRSFYQPEALFAGYTEAVEVNEDLEGFEFDEKLNLWIKRIEMPLQPCTYIYLTQVILHNNRGRIVGVDGTANLSGMARSVNLNTGVAGSDAITVHYNCRFKPGCLMKGENVDIAGGRLMTFGMCDINGSRVDPATKEGEDVPSVDDGRHHYMDLVMTFNNGLDSTFVFDVTKQVHKRYKGGVLTVELDVDTVPIPSRSGGSGFDAVVKEFEDSVTYEFEM